MDAKSQCHLRYIQMGSLGVSTLSELVTIVAKVEGMDPARVGLIARSVREDGLITTGGRGSSAGKMTILDATNLLIAVNTAETAREAPSAVRRYRRLEAVDYEKQRRFQFGESLEQLIHAASIKALPERYLFNPVPPLIARDFSNDQIRINLKFHKPTARAEIRIFATKSHKQFNWKGDFGKDFRDELVAQVTGLIFEFRPPAVVADDETKRLTDRRDTTTIGYPSIRALGEVLSP
jgi:hypothetical protein